MKESFCMSPDQMWLEWHRIVTKKGGGGKIGKGEHSDERKPGSTTDRLLLILLTAFAVIWLCFVIASTAGCSDFCLNLLLAFDAVIGIALVGFTKYYKNTKRMERFQDGSALAALEEWKSAVGISDPSIPEVKAALEKSVSREESSRSSFLSVVLTFFAAGMLTCAIAIVSPYADSWESGSYTLVVFSIFFSIFFVIIWAFWLRCFVFPIWRKCPLDSLRLLEDCLAADAIYGDRPCEPSSMASFR